MDFSSFARQSDSHLDLVTGALLVARDVYPELDVSAYKARVEELGAPLREQQVAELPLDDQVRILGNYVYAECGFHGNRSDYYDPRNSYLNDVLERRTGIPITLAMVYVAIARRAGVLASGVSFPGHFLVRVDHPGERRMVIVDPFGSGEVLDREGVEHLFLRAAGGSGPMQDSVLQPANTRQVLVRVLANLRSIYARRGELSKLLVVLDRLLDLTPDALEARRDRGLLSAKLGAPQAAIGDLERFVADAPSSPEAPRVRRIIEQLQSVIQRTAN